MSKIEGSCFCQSVRYDIKEVEPGASVCHCGFCRSLNGSDYTIWVSVPSNKFQVTEGQDLLTAYKASENITTRFCSLCGTRVYNVDSRYSNSSVLRATITSPVEIEVKREWFKEQQVPRPDKTTGK